MRTLGCAILVVMLAAVAAAAGNERTADPVTVEFGWIRYDEAGLGLYDAAVGGYIGALVGIRDRLSVYASVSKLDKRFPAADQLGLSLRLRRRYSLVRPVARVGILWSRNLPSRAFSVGGGVYVGERFGGVAMFDVVPWTGGWPDQVYALRAGAFYSF